MINTDPDRHCITFPDRQAARDAGFVRYPCRGSIATYRGVDIHEYSVETQAYLCAPINITPNPQGDISITTRVFVQDRTLVLVDPVKLALALQQVETMIDTLIDSEPLSDDVDGWGTPE